MASKKHLNQIEIQTLTNLINPTTGFIGLGAKSDGLYQKIGSIESKLSTVTESDSKYIPFTDSSYYAKGVGKGSYYRDVVNCSIHNTVYEILIKTKIPFISSSQMPLIHLEGYAYGAASPIELRIAFYIYNSTFVSVGCTSTCPWKPTIKLFTYVDGGNTYVGLALAQQIYFPQFTVNYIDVWGGGDGIQSRNYSLGWTTEYNTASSPTIIPTDNLTTVTYRPIANDISGNSATTTKLQTARTIAGVNFDGSNNIEIPFANLISKPTSLSAYGILSSDTLLTDKNASLITTSTASGVTNTSTTNTNTFLNIVQGGSSLGSSTQITGAGSVTVSSDIDGKLTITGSTNYVPLTGGTMTGALMNRTKISVAHQASSSALVELYSSSTFSRFWMNSPNGSEVLKFTGFDAGVAFQMPSITTKVRFGTYSDQLGDAMLGVNGTSRFVGASTFDNNLTVVGEVTAFSTSDNRLKENIKPLTNSLSIINQIKPVSYNWNEKAKLLNSNKTGKTDVGVIAQEIRNVLPDVVGEMYNGEYLGVDYIKLIPYLISSIQELSKEINELKTQIK